MDDIVEILSDSDDSDPPSQSSISQRSDDEVEQMVLKYIREQELLQNSIESNVDKKGTHSNNLVKQPVQISTGAQEKPTAPPRQLKARDKLIKQALNTVTTKLKSVDWKQSIVVHIDPAIISIPVGDAIIETLTKGEVNFLLVEQKVPSSITWIRSMQTAPKNSKQPNIEDTNEMQPTDDIILLLTCSELVNHVKKRTLRQYISTIKQSKIILLIIGLNDYYKKQERTQARRRHDETEKDPTYDDIEESLIEIQIHNECSNINIDNAMEAGLWVFQCSKAVAQLPSKLEKFKRDQQANWYMAGENKDCVKVDKHGNGLNRLWIQMLMSFPLVGLDTAEAIAQRYPTLGALLKAYGNVSPEKGSTLLQDIPIRRAAGPLTTARKIGPELSRKLYTFYTTMDANTPLS